MSTSPSRDRHLPRLCRACHAPLARQEDSCWRCGIERAFEDAPRIPSRPKPAPLPAVVAEKNAA
jgi:predicted amidophosphoribosyltransferase